MSGEPERSHLPVKGAAPEPLAYHLAVAFYPSIKLTKKNGLGFAADLADFIETDSVKIESGQWVLDCSSASDRSTMTVTPNQLEFKIQRPGNAPEWYERRYRSFLSSFAVRFKPEAVLASRAVVRGLLRIDGDARVFLGGYIMQIKPEQIVEPMKRPVHIIGLRLVFPPYQEVDVENQDHVIAETDWSVTVRVESWGPDPSRLYLEADARWTSPCGWTNEEEINVVGRLSTVIKFMNNELLSFLSRRRGAEDSQ